jgi:hypothetical protein
MVLLSLQGPLGIRMAKKAINQGMEAAEMSSILAAEGECYEQALRFTECRFWLGIRYLPNRSLRFFGIRVNSVLQKSVPIGSLKNSVPRVVGIGKFGSVPVLTEHREDAIACSKTNFDMIS